jgi:hypothetical protein
MPSFSISLARLFRHSQEREIRFRRSCYGEIALERWLAITLISSLIGGSRPRSFWTSFAGEKGSQELSPWIVFGTLPRTLGFRSPHRSLASTERPTVHLIDHTLGWRSP